MASAAPVFDIDFLYIDSLFKMRCNILFVQSMDGWQPAARVPPSPPYIPAGLFIDLIFIIYIPLTLCVSRGLLICKILANDIYIFPS